MKKINKLMHVYIVFFLVTSILFTIEVNAQQVFSLAHISPEDHPSHKGSLLFKQLVEERTNGSIKIEIYPNSTLGSAPEYTEQMKLGAVAFGLSTSGQLQQWVKEYAAVMIPFLFKSYEHAHRTLDGPAGELLAEMAVKEDLIALANWEWGFRQITNNKVAIQNPEDVKGLKMRVPNEIQLQEMYKALGASTNIVAFPELYLALAQGVVDGQCNPLNTIYHNKFYEVQKFLAITNHVYNTQMLMVSKMVWDTLSEDIQRVLKESAYVAGIYVRQISNEADEKLIMELEKEGMIVTYPKLESFAEKMGPAVKTIAEFAGEEFTNQFIQFVHEAQ